MLYALFAVQRCDILRYFPVFKKIMNVLYNLLGVWKINYKFGTITYVLHAI